MPPIRTSPTHHPRLANRLRHAALTGMGLLGLALPAWAAPVGVSSFRTPQVEVSLVPATKAVRPGEPLTIGLHQEIIPHWHTYWSNPGDSGIATTIEWTLPPGAQAGPIQWPLPKRFDLGPITNHGYERAVTLLSDITVPATLKAGERFQVTAKVNWLVCAEVCIPQKATLALTLPVEAVSAGAAKAQPGDEDPLIQAARAELPTKANWPVHAELRGQQLGIDLSAALKTNGASVKQVLFFPQDWGRINHNARQHLHEHEGLTRLLLETGEAPPAADQPLPGLLVLTQMIDGQEVRRGFDIAPVVKQGAGTPFPAPTTALAMQSDSAAPVGPSSADELTVLTAIALAFIGGLVLNLMPCVFPVLSIKALSLLKHSGQSAWQARGQGLSYTAGVLGSFTLLAGLLLMLKATGAQIGWGFQFQSPVFVLAMAYLMFAVGLSLSGVFTIGGSLAGVGSSLADKPGHAGSFFTGVLATVVATPCTAPFMGGAIGFALGQPAPVVFAVFLSLGLGLASPYLLLSWWPGLQHRLPRPGAWMERFKEFLAFPMYAAAAWLVWVLAQQAGVNAAGAALLGMVAIGFAAWVYDSTRHSPPRARHVGLALASVGLASAILGGHASLNLDGDGGAGIGTSSASASGKHWQPYTPVALSELRGKGEPVFVNLTAAWCITCLANERVALSQRAIVEAFKARGITYLKGDWTNQDAEITKLLAKFGRSGVPLYLYYPPGANSQPVVLPQILTPDIVLSALKDAPAKVALVKTQP